MLLPKLGSFFRPAYFRVVVCADCGLTRFYTEPEARTKLLHSGAWQRV